MASVCTSVGGVGVSPCLSDAGYIQGESIRSEGVIAAAALRLAHATIEAKRNYDELRENYKKQRDIADRSVTIAERQQGQLEEVYWPRETQFLNEFSDPETVEEIEVMGRRYAGRIIASMAGEFSKGLRRVKCNNSRYCTSANEKSLQDLYLTRATTFANARVLGRQLAYAEYVARNERNFRRRQQAIAWGRGLIDRVVSLYQSAFQALQVSGAVLSQRLNQALFQFGDAFGDLSSGIARRNRLANLANFSDNVPASGRAQIQSAIGPFSPVPGNTPVADALNSFGQETSIGMMTDLNAGQLPISWRESAMGNQTWSRDYLNNVWDHSESRNYGQPRQQDKARVGARTYTIVDDNGDTATFTINMDDFSLGEVNYRDECICTPASVG